MILSSIFILLTYPKLNYHQNYKNKYTSSHHRKKISLLTLLLYPNNPQEIGSNEKHNSLIRRFLPKGKSLLNYNEDHYIKIMNWMNNLPRKILNYHTPIEVFIEELNNLGLLDDSRALVQFYIAI